jgi:hypothetical protein
LATGDFNADNYKDLVAANFSNMSLLLGRGNSGFNPASHFAQGTPYFVAVGDFNSDNAEDLAVAEQFGDVSILLGIGDGTFSPSRSLAVGFGGSIAIGDFNHDGAEDLAVTANYGPFFSYNLETQGVSILLGNGDGTFGPSRRLTTGTGASFVAFGDFDSDGNQDLVITNAISNDVSVFLGLGDGSFAPQVRFPVGAFPMGVDVADFDGDGIDDVVVANGFDRDVSMLSGRGDGSFEPQTRFPLGGEAAYFLATGDFDRDGWTDLALANGVDISILLNRTPGAQGNSTNASNAVRESIRPGRERGAAIEGLPDVFRTFTSASDRSGPVQDYGRSRQLKEPGEIWQWDLPEFNVGMGENVGDGCQCSRTESGSSKLSAPFCRVDRWEGFDQSNVENVTIGVGQSSMVTVVLKNVDAP